MEQVDDDSVPSAGHLVTMTEDGLMLACETVEFDPVEEEADQGQLKESVLSVKDIIEVDQPLVPYRGEDGDNDDDDDAVEKGEDKNSELVS